MNKQEVLKEHIAFKKLGVKSYNKITDIERVLNRFLNSTEKSLDKFQEKDLIDYLNSISDKYSVRTFNDIKVYIKVFIKWHFDDFSLRFKNLDTICKTSKPPKSHEPEQMLSVKEVEKIIEGEKDLFWKTFFLVYFFGGFRPIEACKLEWKDISFDDEGTTIKVFSTKTQKTFYKGLPPSATHCLKEWRKYNHSNFIFPSPLKKDLPIVTKSVCARLKKVSKRTIGKEVAPYTLRHSLATIKYNDKNLRPDDVANHMGHCKNMKEVYVNLNEKSLKANARTLWAKPDKLSPEKKHKLELRLKKLEKLFSQSQEEHKKTLKKYISFIDKVEEAQRKANT